MTFKHKRVKPGQELKVINKVVNSKRSAAMKKSWAERRNLARGDQPTKRTGDVTAADGDYGRQTHQMLQEILQILKGADRGKLVDPIVELRGHINEINDKITHLCEVNKLGTGNENAVWMNREYVKALEAKGNGSATAHAIEVGKRLDAMKGGIKAAFDAYVGASEKQIKEYQARINDRISDLERNVDAHHDVLRAIEKQLQKKRTK